MWACKNVVMFTRITAYEKAQYPDSTVRQQLAHRLRLPESRIQVPYTVADAVLTLCCDALLLLNHFAPGQGAKYCDQRVCLSVCLCVIKTSRHFHYTLPVAVVRASSDDNAIRYVLPVLWV